MDRACVDECPVDCIYQGGRSLYIHPDECIDCGACTPVCPVQAIFYQEDLPAEWSEYADDSERFFAGAPSGRATPLGE
jgi:NAD-dependent dihydropyrimidine dehydrogenase PreA subunit